MESKAKALGHPIHQMLIPFPFGLLATAVIFDIIYLIWGNPTQESSALFLRPLSASSTGSQFQETHGLNQLVCFTAWEM
jgi:uncharacterized membrane protein